MELSLDAATLDLYLRHAFRGMAAVLDRDEGGNLIRKAGVMAIVLHGGAVSPGAPIEVHLPPEPHQPLQPV